MKLSLLFLLFVPLANLACSPGGTAIDAAPPPGAGIVCFVPGVAGDHGGYAGLRSALQEAGAADVREFSWGSPIFLFNFQSTSIHDAAENQLANRLADWLRQKPDCRIDLIGHSAGGGVILGALRRLPEGLLVDHVVLLAPSVSPGYDLEPALRHVRSRAHLFYSDKDVVFLKWRTGTFGTYDNIRTPAAGHTGFHPKAPLPANLAARLTQHAYDPAWGALGNDGSHTGPTAHDFVRSVVAPLLQE